MLRGNELVPYERLMTARPVLLWGIERRWTAQEASDKGCDLTAKENSAWLVMEGIARVNHDGQEYTAEPGQWMFPKPGQRFQSFEGPFHFISVTLNWQWPDGRHVFNEGLTRCLKAAEAPWLEEVASDVINQVRLISPTTHYYIGMRSMTLMQSALIFELAAKWARAFCRAMDHLKVGADMGTIRDPRVEAVLNALRRSCGEPAIDRERLASTLGVSARQIDRLLKQATGMTLAENRDALRYNLACNGLLEQGCRVKEVASRVGFGDLSTFSRWFTRHSGCAPRAYRERFGARLPIDPQ